MEDDEFEFIRMNNNLVCVNFRLVLHADLPVTVPMGKRGKGGKRGSLSHGNDDAYVTFCHFGYEVFSEKNKQTCKTKQNSCLLF